MVGYDCDQEKTDNRHRDQPRQKSKSKTNTAHELHDADHIGPEESIFESNALEEFRGGCSMPE